MTCYIDNSEADPKLKTALGKYFTYQRKIHDLQRIPTREEVAEVYAEDCKITFAGRNPIIGRTFNGIDDWLTVYEASFNIVDYVNIESEYIEAVGTNHAFNHDTHLIVVKGDNLRFERVDIFSRSGDRIKELRILEYDQFAFDDFIRKHHPAAPTKKNQWRSHVTYLPADDDEYKTDDSSALMGAISQYLQFQSGLEGKTEKLIEAITPLITDDAELIIQGRNPLGYGVYQGPQQWANYYQFANRVASLNRYENISIEAIGSERGFVFDDHMLRLGRAETSFRRLLVFRQDAGRVCQLRVLYFEPYKLDEFVNFNLCA